MTSRPSLSALLAPYLGDLRAFRRDLHAHPELSRAEFRTTGVLAERLTAAGLSPQPLPSTGLTCQIGRGNRVVGLRADLDALPVREETGLEFASTIPGVSHACGHDVHATIVLGTGLVLAELNRRRPLPGGVRLIFQPAEEVQPSGSLDVIDAGGLDGLDRIYALHCDPGLDVGRVGIRAGSLTSASDLVEVRLRGSGGHTSRPQLTEDVVFALAQVVTGVPAVLSRRVDPRAGVAMVWGQVSAGVAANVIPRAGEASGTVRCLDAKTWSSLSELVPQIVREIVQPYGVDAEIRYVRGVPPTVNDPDAVLQAEEAVLIEIGPGSTTLAPQSLGGEDFAWMLEKVSGAMLRLGTRTPSGPTYDLHRGDLVIDEDAIAVGVRTLVALVLRELSVDSPGDRFGMPR